MAKQKRPPAADGEILTKQKAKTKRPPMFKVILLNDDYTSMEFVVMILETVFNKSRPEAVEVMLAVHTAGRGVAGIYTRELAETKIAHVEALAQMDGFPLKCLMEPE